MARTHASPSRRIGDASLQPRSDSSGFSALIEEFSAHLERGAFAPATIRSYVADVRGFARWLSEQSRNSSLTIPRAREFGRYRQHLIEETNQSPATINRRLHSLRVFGRFLRQAGYVKHDPARRLPLVIPESIEPSPPRILDDDEIAQLRLAVRASARPRLMRRDYAIIELMLQAGLRVNEVAALNLDDLVLTTHGMRLRVRNGTDMRIRQVPLPETLARALREYLAMRPPWPHTSRLFVSQQGKPLSTRSIQRLVEEYADAAQLEDVCANSLRHTCAKKLLAEHPPHLVAEWLGHKSIEALNRYR